MEEQFIKYLEEKGKEADAEEEALKQSERKDEANLVKVRANIYNVCKTIFQSVAKAEYMGKLEHLLNTWDASYQKAKEFEDVRKLVVEEIKIETLKDIRKEFLTVFSSSQTEVEDD